MVILKRKFGTRLNDVFEKGKSIFGDKEECYITGHCAKGYGELTKYIDSGGCDTPNVFYFNFSKAGIKGTVKNEKAIKAIMDKSAETVVLDVNISEYLEFAKEYGNIWEKEFGEGKATIYY